MRNLAEEIEIENRNIWKERDRLLETLGDITEIVEKYNPNQGSYGKLYDKLIGYIINSKLPLSTQILMFCNNVKSLELKENMRTYERDIMNCLKDVMNK